MEIGMEWILIFLAAMFAVASFVASFEDKSFVAVFMGFTSLVLIASTVMASACDDGVICPCKVVDGKYVCECQEGTGS